MKDSAASSSDHGLSRRSFVSSLASATALLGTGSLLSAPNVMSAAETPVDSNQKETVVAFGAHPADIFSPAGATLLKHALRGDRVIAVPLTAGLGHLWHPPLGTLGKLKTEKTAQFKTFAQAKAYYLGLVKETYAELKPVELHMLDLQDSPLAISVENIKAVAEVIRQYQPSIVISHHPTMALLAGHPDHRDCGELVLRAIMLAMEDNFMESSHPTASPTSRILCYASSERWQALGQADAPNLFVDVRDTAAAKDKAALAHQVFGVTPASLKDGWAKSAQPGYPHLEAFVQLRPIVVDYLRSSPGRPWLAA